MENNHPPLHEQQEHHRASTDGKRHAGQRVLLTGATSGIGYELGKCFAADGFNMVIVARTEADLEAVASEFRALGAPEVVAIPCDLSQPDGAINLYNQTNRQGLQIDVLVNDAGQGQRGPFVDTLFPRDLEVITLNITSLVHLTKVYLREMVDRNEGRILQLSSIAAFQPTPLLAVYSATKAFVQHLTDALINELKDTNVTLTALLPTATDTDFFNKADATDTKAAHMGASAEEAAKNAYEALMKGEHRAYGNLKAKIEANLSAHLPNQTVAAMARAYMQNEGADPENDALLNMGKEADAANAADQTA
jgi:uncharacterized protein